MEISLWKRSKFLFSDAMQRYNKLCMKRLLEDNKQYQVCRNPSCPSDGPYGAYIGDNGDAAWLDCPVCNLRTCIACDVVWHNGLSCKKATKERKRLKKQEEISERRNFHTVRRCPRCNVLGERVDGCDHITCPMCQLDYCWACLTDPYNRRHSWTYYCRTFRYYKFMVERRRRFPL